MLDELELCDVILDYIREDNIDITYHDIHEICESREHPDNISKYIICRNQLEKDGFLTHWIKDPNFIRITADGLTFIKKGGYKGRQKKQRSKKLRDDIIKWTTLAIALLAFIKSFFFTK